MCLSNSEPLDVPLKFMAPSGGYRYFYEQIGICMTSVSITGTLMEPQGSVLSRRDVIGIDALHNMGPLVVYRLRAVHVPLVLGYP